jgi:TPP-dependent pyruvate/acetoin dehydrogenase alpha subunit
MVGERGSMTPDKDIWLRLYETMMLIRVTEESFVAPILDGTIRCPVHLYSGQEAIAAGVCATLRNDDYVFGNHRSHGHYLAKGGSLDGLVAEVYCRDTGCARGRGGSMHVVAPEHGMLGAAPIVAGTISLAVGAALASKIRGDDRVTVSFFGDGAAGEGVLYEAMNTAAIWKLPILFVCENNGYSTHLPIRECRAQEPVWATSPTLGVPAASVDGNDVLAVYDVARSATEACRSGAGPRFIEALTYRQRGHVGPDDNIQGSHTDIRLQSEIDAWRERDPIMLLERRLLAQAGVTKAELNLVRERVAGQVEAAHRKAVSAAFPDSTELLHHVFID